MFRPWIWPHLANNWLWNRWNLFGSWSGGPSGMQWYTQSTFLRQFNMCICVSLLTYSPAHLYLFHYLLSCLVVSCSSLKPLHCPVKVMWRILQARTCMKRHICTELLWHERTVAVRPRMQTHIVATSKWHARKHCAYNNLTPNMFTQYADDYAPAVIARKQQ